MSNGFRDVGRRDHPRDPEGKAALFSAAARPRPGTVIVQCSDCGVSSELSYTEFLGANLPIGMWFPPLGVRFNRRMTCPECRQWTWMRARWR